MTYKRSRQRATSTILATVGKQLSVRDVSESEPSIDATTMNLARALSSARAHRDALVAIYDSMQVIVDSSFNTSNDHPHTPVQDPFDEEGRIAKKAAKTRRTLTFLSLSPAGSSVASMVAVTSMVPGEPDVVVNHEFGGSLPAAAGAFFSFMEARENLRKRKEDLRLPFPWTDDPVLSSKRFTNVKREDDATTRWMRLHWTGPNAASADVGETIFNCALFRYFGTPELAARLTWVKDTWCPSEVVHQALQLRATGHHAFTRAYCKPHYNSESTDAKQGFKAYEKICFKYLDSLWKARHELTRVATETRSWKALVDELRCGKSNIVGFGGVGFMAKEVVCDAMQCPALVDLIDDRNLWCPCGPGARRGLNRLFGRPTSLCVNEQRLTVEALYIGELRSLHTEIARVRPAWCRNLKLELHDVQFMLCEFDKYMRAKLGERGASVAYSPPHLRESHSKLALLTQSEVQQIIRCTHYPDDTAALKSKEP